MVLLCSGEESEAAADGDYASENSEADDEVTLEEEDALAAQDGIDRAVSAHSVTVLCSFCMRSEHVLLLLLLICL